MKAGRQGFEITCDKVASLDPTWARFPGLTVLYDNERSAASSLYAAVAETVSGLAPADTAAQHGLCLLPPSTYHVTVCDALNIRKRDQWPKTVQVAFDRAVSRLDEAAPALPAELEVLRPTGLDATSVAHPVRLGVSGIEVRGHAVVAGLRPLDAVSSAGLVALGRERDGYAKRMAAGLGTTTQDWRPHVTVGYLANTGLDRSVRPLIDTWTRVLAERLDATATFTGATLYGFTDMTNFIRFGSAA